MPDLLIEMPSGVAGDMLLAALIDLGADPDAITADLAALEVGPIPLRCDQVAPGGIVATRVTVEVPQDAQWQQTAIHEHGHGHEHAHGHHPHRPYRDIRELLERASLPERARARAQAAFRLLAEAEGAAHGVDPDDVHFHEVGALDAIADVVGCCLALEQLVVDRVVAGPFTLGSGSVRCAHGRMPVPVPAVVHMLAATGAPQRRLDAETGELTTPTGCALVCALADGFSPATVGDLQAVGYGAGHKTIPGMGNLLRANLCRGAGNRDGEVVSEIRCQFDDITGEQLAWTIEQLIERGARDAWATPIVMKKGRPAHQLSVLCDPPQRPSLCDWILSHTPTIGLRYGEAARQILPRREELVHLDGQAVGMKVVTLPDGSERAKPESDDLRAIAAATGRPLADLAEEALRAWRGR